MITVIIVAILLVSFNVFVVLGNGFVIVAVRTFWKLKNNITTIFITSLAISDLSLGLLVLPFSLTNEVFRQRWLFGVTICYLWLATDVLLSTASILNIVIIASERYLAICLPFKYPSLMSSARAKGFVVAVWILSFVICVPTIQLIFNGSTDMTQNLSYNGNMTCSIKHSGMSYKIYSAMGSFYIPLVFVLFFYCQIFRKVHQNVLNLQRGTIKIHRHMPSSTDNSMGVHRGGKFVSKTTPFNRLPLTSNEDEWRYTFLHEKPPLGVDNINLSPNQRPDVPLIADESKSPQVSKRKRIFRKRTKLYLSKLSQETKAATMLGVVCGTFLICWLPFFVWYLSSAFVVLDESSISFSIFFWLGYLNSGLNPVIYVVWSKDFRQAFVKMFCYRIN